MRLYSIYFRIMWEFLVGLIFFGIGVYILILLVFCFIPMENYERFILPGIFSGGVFGGLFLEYLFDSQCNICSIFYVIRHFFMYITPIGKDKWISNHIDIMNWGNENEIYIHFFSYGGNYYYGFTRDWHVMTYKLRWL